MGMIMIFAGIGIIAAAVILTILFRIKRPVYQPEERLIELNRKSLNNELYNRVTLPLTQNENQEQ